MPFVASRRLEDLLDPDAGARCSQRIADAGGTRLERNTQRLTPVAPPSPNRGARPPAKLRRSIHRSRVERARTAAGAGYRVRVSTDDPVGPYVEWNTRPHIIRPRIDRAPATVVETGRARGTVQDGRAALSWIGGDGRVFARTVHHPGTTGHHMFARGAAQTEAEVALVAAEPVARFERELVPVRTGRVLNLRAAG